jgi:hypothetical protein
LKAEDVTPGSEIANIIGKLDFYSVYTMKLILTNHREGNRELQVVAEATWLLAHITELQPVHCLLQARAGFGG